MSFRFHDSKANAKRLGNIEYLENNIDQKELALELIRSFREFFFKKKFSPKGLIVLNRVFSSIYILLFTLLFKYN